jgi:hypothetical protein
VEAGRRLGVDVFLFEPEDAERDERNCEVEDGDELRAEGAQVDAGDEGTPHVNIYMRQVPILNGTYGRDRPYEDSAAWHGRTVMVGNILRRWFNFTGQNDT